MSPSGPPTPDDRPWTADHISTNGSTGHGPARVRTTGPGRLVVLAYITSFALPLLGLFLGVVVITRPNHATSKHGRWIIILSVVGSIIWALVFASGVLTSTSNDMGY